MKIMDSSEKNDRKEQIIDALVELILHCKMNIKQIELKRNKPIIESPMNTITKRLENQILDLVNEKIHEYEIILLSLMNDDKITDSLFNEIISAKESLNK
jgi:hypothetical protein